MKMKVVVEKGKAQKREKRVKNRGFDVETRYVLRRIPLLRYDTLKRWYFILFRLCVIVMVVLAFLGRHTGIEVHGVKVLSEERAFSSRAHCLTIGVES